MVVVVFCGLGLVRQAEEAGNGLVLPKVVVDLC